ncbi:MAG: chemotaxis protein CheW, partial [Betaproteobacteria bacterium]|nr:chemotaxis protein CheW [Betaproteobacteria bacterium]
TPPPPAAPVAAKTPAKPEAAKPASVESTSIRVGIEKVDQLINLVGELVITQAMLAQTAADYDPVQFERLLNGLTLLERNTRDLQEAVMSIRMMPMSFVFSRFPRVVRDLASKLGKQIELKTIGESTELDKSLIEKITDPLTHLVRNSLDHGIEMPEERLAKGKPAKGTLTLSAAHQGGNIVIEVADDGQGLNRERILAKAKERGLPVHDNMPDQEVWQLIFAPGFSTAAQITDVSGRGVGMDVVKKNIESLGGRVDLYSVSGQGSRVTIRLPLTLAILDGMSVALGNETFIVPLTYIMESLQPPAHDIKTVAGQGRVVHVRGDYLPLVALHQVLNIEPKFTDPSSGIVIIVEADGERAALFVDELVGQHQVVIKSLESNYRKVPGIAAATIMGDGRVALILDVAALVRMSKQ